MKSIIKTKPDNGPKPGSVPVPAPEPLGASNVIDIMAALRKSIAAMKKRKVAA